MEEKHLELIQVVKDNFSGIDKIDDLLSLLKNMGASQADSAFALAYGLNISLGEVHEIVVNSPIWRENKAFHDMFSRFWY